MAHLIDKDALVAEIEKCKKEIPTGRTWGDQIEEGSRIGQEEAYDKVLHFINTLEVKEVDLEQELEDWLGERVGLWTGKECERLCRHFFELGLKAKG